MKKILSLAVAAAMVVGVIGIFAMPAEVPATTMTARFTVTEGIVHSDTQLSMISEDGELVIHINENVPVYFEDAVPLCDDCDELTFNVREVLFGRTLAEVLDGRELEVQFAISTASIPAQTTPVSVRVMFETAVHLDGDFEWDEDFYVGLEWEYFDWSDWEDEIWIPELNGEFVINNEIMEGFPAPFWHVNEKIAGGTVAMVPLRAIAEALGYYVSWSEETQSVMLGNAIHLFIGGTEVYIGRMAPIEISTAPIIVDSSTFVPLDFVRNVLGQNAWTFEGQVVIDSDYEMY